MTNDNGLMTNDESPINIGCGLLRLLDLHVG